MSIELQDYTNEQQFHVESDPVLSPEFDRAPEQPSNVEATEAYRTPDEKDTIAEARGGMPEHWNKEFSGEGKYRLDSEQIVNTETGESLITETARAYGVEEAAMLEEQLGLLARGEVSVARAPDYIEETPEKTTVYVTQYTRDAEGNIGYEIWSYEVAKQREEDETLALERDRPIPEYAYIEANAYVPDTHTIAETNDDLSAEAEVAQPLEEHQDTNDHIDVPQQYEYAPERIVVEHGTEHEYVQDQNFPEVPIAMHKESEIGTTGQSIDLEVPRPIAISSEASAETGRIESASNDWVELFKSEPLDFTFEITAELPRVETPDHVALERDTDTPIVPEIQHRVRVEPSPAQVDITPQPDRHSADEEPGQTDRGAEVAYEPSTDRNTGEAVPLVHSIESSVVTHFVSTIERVHVESGNLEPATQHERPVVRMEQGKHRAVPEQTIARTETLQPIRTMDLREHIRIEKMNTETASHESAHERIVLPHAENVSTQTESIVRARLQEIRRTAESAYESHPTRSRRMTLEPEDVKKTSGRRGPTRSGITLRVVA